MTPPKEVYKAAENDLKEMEIYNLPDKIIILKRSNEMQENMERQPKNVRKTMHKQNDTFTKETEAT